MRAAVLDKVKAQATDDIYEPVDPASPRGAGKKWASQFNEEDRTRKEAREKARHCVCLCVSLRLGKADTFVVRSVKPRSTAPSKATWSTPPRQ